MGDAEASELNGSSIDSPSSDGATTRSVDRSGEASCRVCKDVCPIESSASMRCRSSCSVGVGVPRKVVPWLNLVEFLALRCSSTLSSTPLSVEELE